MTGHKKEIQQKNIRVVIVFYGLLIVASIFLPELFYRMYKGISVLSLKPKTYLEPHSQLGWRPTPFYRHYAIEPDDDGNKYGIHYTTTYDGFREFGSIHSKKNKVFLVGDSFTNAVMVSNSRTYYYLLKERLDFELFAYGGAGYGTFQEMLILKKYMDQIQPDLIVIQLCENDFINNYLDLERSSYKNNNNRPRPYFRPKKNDFVATPYTSFSMRFFTTLSNMASNQSYLLTDLIIGLKNYEFRNNPGIEQEILTTKGSFPEFQESLNVTDKIFQQIREMAGKTPILTFTSENSAFHESFFQPIAVRHQMIFIPNVGKQVEEKNIKGATVRARDHHWGERGHKIVAQLLAPELDKLLKPKP